MLDAFQGIQAEPRAVIADGSMDAGPTLKYYKKEILSQERTPLTLMS